MKRTHDSRGSKDAVKERADVKGGSDAKELQGGGKPQSWKQYIDQAMPPQEQAKKEEPQPQAGPVRPDRRAEAKAAWDGLRRKAEEAGRSAAQAAGGGWSRVNGLTAGRLEKAGQGIAKVRDMVARHPVSPLLYATVLAAAICWTAFRGTYVRAYVMEVNGQPVGLVSSEDEGKAIVSNVGTRAASVLGEDYDYEPQVDFAPAYAAPDALSDTVAVEDALFDGVGAYMTAYAISVDGVEIGRAADSGELYRLLDEIAQPYLPADAIRYEFVEDVQITPVEMPANSTFDLESIRAELSALSVEEATYEVKKGDTFNAIAYSLDMMPNELSVLNPDVIVNKLWVGQELIIQQAVPRLSVRVVTNETYEQEIPSPVEYIETAELYVGDTKVKEQGEDGMALINAQVTYVNNVELDREVLSSQTIKEATTTYTYTGTTPRPVTASNGYFIWPVRGTITSNFGGRNLWGSYDFHLGLDIAVPYGTGIKAADGGTVIKAGWNGSYGLLVAIRHDNGIVTYYGHNSSVLVSVGQKVYQGQIIARAGSTGNSSGNHCHFEVRVNGTSVNPRNYL